MFRTLFLFMISSPLLFSQKKDLQVKGNLLTAPIGILNGGIEYSLSNRMSIQAEGLISPWKSFAGNHLQIYMGFVEGRYYFSEAMNNFYVGSHIGVGFFDIQKWNYWNTDKYQRGVALLTGATIGFQKQLNDRFGFDFFISGGHSQGNYHGYQEGVGRYEDAENFNKSREWLIYKAGIMLTYKIKRSAP